MPTSAPGSDGPQARSAPGPSPEGNRKPRGGLPESRGFTLIELLVVVAILALTTSLVSLALRDSREQQLEREGTRLALLLETARAESRASGLPVWWVPAAPAAAPDGGGFRFVGLGPKQAMPSQWLEAEVQAEVEGGARLQLGPEALIGAQRVRLRLGDRQVTVETDGLAPFELRSGDGS